MASDHSTTPAAPGLTSQVATMHRHLAAFVDELRPDTLLGADADTLYGSLAKMERLVVAAKTLLAPRIAASGHWETEGHHSPAALLATLEGVSTGQARRTLTTGQRLEHLPGAEAALRSGVLSGPKAALIADAATLDPTTESELVAGAGDEGIATTKERCARVRATAAKADPLASARRIHAERHFSHWTDAEGAFCYQGRDSAERGAALLARLVPAANRLRDARRAADGTGDRPGADTSTDSRPESDAALRADALFALVTGGTPGRGGKDDGAERGGDQDLRNADHLATRQPPATVIVRVDLEALLRGRALPGEACELDGQGPIPVPLARALAVDSFLNIVFTEAGDIRSVCHRGRTINATLRTALTFRDRCCVVPGCTMAFGLEIDHVTPMEFGGVTTLDNLALLCTHHHRKKTYEGWVLERHGPSDADPQWSFTPLPPFGQEPDLGLDRKPDATTTHPAQNTTPSDGGTRFDRLPEVVPRR